ncbi:craniofacial development protein 1 [Erpetoichthys calabaricus]|uniref:Craniofacial development protein 1 n=1 Tax=Erpetoichthys calabaricus TaxID=27687 RepID=A0A8C4S1J4_ERPCA|nr:craniofacial development protein 1 [Erpetoichthys calabaricus]
MLHVLFLISSFDCIRVQARRMSLVVTCVWPAEDERSCAIFKDGPCASFQFKRCIAMNVSDYDSENYSSDEDEDYVPSGEDDSEDDGKDLVPEDEIDGDDQGIPQDDDDGKVTSNKNKSTRKRKKKRFGITLNKAEEEHNREEVTDPKKSEHNIKEETENEKSRADSLWASFLSDVPRPKPTNTTVPHTLMADQIIPDQHHEGNKTKEVFEPSKEPSKITITKVFDFAGEEVRVSKEVDSYSKEAKSFMKKVEEDSGKQPSTEGTDVSSYSGACSSGLKRTTGLGGILNRIGGKKQKLSTLEKSKLDWESFKNEEGIGEELATHNRGKDGYMERKAFLERVDQRQFEIEKSIRLSNMKR